MPNINLEDNEELLSELPYVSELLPRLVEHLDNIYAEVDENELDQSTVTISCETFVDTVELLFSALELYEGVDLQEIAGFIEAQRVHKHFVSNSKH